MIITLDLPVQPFDSKDGTEISYPQQIFSSVDHYSMEPFSAWLRAQEARSPGPLYLAGSMNRIRGRLYHRHQHHAKPHQSVASNRSIYGVALVDQACDIYSNRTLVLSAVEDAGLTVPVYVFVVEEHRAVVGFEAPLRIDSPYGRRRCS